MNIRDFGTIICSVPKTQEQQFINWLDDGKISYKVGDGCYQGECEDCYIIVLNSRVDVDSLAGLLFEEFTQDSYLLVNKDNSAELVFFDGHIEQKGLFHTVPEAVAKKRQEYTKSGGYYYVTTI